MSSLTPKTHLFHVLFLPLLPYMFDFWAKTSPNGSHQRYLGAPEAFTMCSGYIWLWWKDLNVNHFPKIGNISCQKLFKLFQKLKADGCGMRHIGASDHWRVHAGNGGRDGGGEGGGMNVGVASAWAVKKFPNCTTMHPLQPRHRHHPPEPYLASTQWLLSTINLFRRLLFFFFWILGFLSDSIMPWLHECWSQTVSCVLQNRSRASSCTQQPHQV